MTTNNAAKRVLVTGGTTFVSRFTARWFVEKGYEVYVLNRGSKPQEAGVKLIQADRHCDELRSKLKGRHFHAVLDICAYNAKDVAGLLSAIESYDDYILISSSAVYPETNPQPFTEGQRTGPNSIWGKYGTDKIAAEQAALERCAASYILRPPYLYGPMQNVYREPFVFDCAVQNRLFYLPKDGGMPLQFFHVADLCRVMEAILETHPKEHIINVGNEDTVTIREFVSMCYAAAGKQPHFVEVHDDIPQRAYFCFHDYAYKLDVSIQRKLLSETVALQMGLDDSFAWYCEHPADVSKRDYIDFIDKHLTKTDS